MMPSLLTADIVAAPSEGPVWQAPPVAVLPLFEEVHIWRISLDVDDGTLAERHATLNAEERSRAAAFRSALARARFVAARGALRTTLASYLETAAATVTFRYNAFGKPELDHRHHDADVRFNLTHAGDLALLAVACGRDVGIDIEERRYIAADLIVDQFFAEPEIAAWRRLPASERAQGFLNGWTRKEAFVKARGLGLSFPLRSFAVSLTPGEAPRLLAAEPVSELDRWTMTTVPVGPGYEAALVVEGHDWRARHWQSNNINLEI